MALKKKPTKTATKTVKKTAPKKVPAKAVRTVTKAAAQKHAKGMSGRPSPEQVKAETAEKVAKVKAAAQGSDSGAKHTPAIPPRPVYESVPTKAQTQKAKAEKAVKRPRFSTADLKQFKLELLAMRDHILGRSSTMRNAALQGTDDINPEEDGTDAFLRLQTLDQVKNQHELIANINQALRAIENGTYGICANCGELIRKQRLEVLPFAKNCIKCQSELESQRDSGHPADKDDE
jgi:RNA polymerase-binding protein DksA